MSARRPRMPVKHTKLQTTTARQAGGAAPAVLARVVGWQYVAMETQDTVGGGASGEGVAVFVGLETDGLISDWSMD